MTAAAADCSAMAKTLQGRVTACEAALDLCLQGAYDVPV